MVESYSAYPDTALNTMPTQRFPVHWCSSSASNSRGAGLRGILTNRIERNYSSCSSFSTVSGVADLFASMMSSELSIQLLSTWAEL